MVHLYLGLVAVNIITAWYSLGRWTMKWLKDLSVIAMKGEEACIASIFEVFGLAADSTGNNRANSKQEKNRIIFLTPLSMASNLLTSSSVTGFSPSLDVDLDLYCPRSPVLRSGREVDISKSSHES